MINTVYDYIVDEGLNLTEGQTVSSRTSVETTFVVGRTITSDTLWTSASGVLDGLYSGHVARNEIVRNLTLSRHRGTCSVVRDVEGKRFSRVGTRRVLLVNTCT